MHAVISERLVLATLRSFEGKFLTSECSSKMILPPTDGFAAMVVRRDRTTIARYPPHSSNSHTDGDAAQANFISKPMVTA